MTPENNMRGHAAFSRARDGSICCRLVVTADDYMVNIGTGHGASDEQARAAALTHAETMLARAMAVYAAAVDTGRDTTEEAHAAEQLLLRTEGDTRTNIEMSYHRHRQANGEWGLWNCRIIGDGHMLATWHGDVLGDWMTGYCLGLGVGATTHIAFSAALSFAKQALETVKRSA